MTPATNPFSPDKPIEHDHRFIDQDQVINEVLKCLNRSESCSIIGGVGMGKTSILKRIERIFSPGAESTLVAKFHFIPIYFKPDLGMPSSLNNIYQQLIDCTTLQIKVWLENHVADTSNTASGFLDIIKKLAKTELDISEGEHDVAFEQFIRKIIDVLGHTVANTKLLFLLDELYAIEEKNVKEDFARHLFKLLDKERDPYLQTHLAIVITCFTDHIEQFFPHKAGIARGFISGSKSIKRIPLEVFKPEHARQLMQSPFNEINREFSDKIADEVYNITGGHPLLLQSTMCDLWDMVVSEETIDIAYVQQRVSYWSERHPDMYHWLDSTIAENRMASRVFGLLRINDGALEWSELTRELSRLSINFQYKKDLRDTLRLLISLGVVTVRELPNRNMTYQVSGKLFLELFGPISRSHVDSDNYRLQINLLEKKLSKMIKQLDQHKNIEGSHDLQEMLRKKLVDLKTDKTGLTELEKGEMRPENPIRADEERKLIRHVHEIAHYVEFEIPDWLKELDIQIKL